MTGEERTDLEDLLRAGADHAPIPGEITGERILELLRGGGAAGGAAARAAQPIPAMRAKAISSRGMSPPEGW